MTVTAGQNYLSAAKTAVAVSTEVLATNDSHAAEATTADDETTRTVDEDWVIVTGEPLPTQTSTSGPCIKRVLSPWGPIELVAAVGIVVRRW